MLVKIPLHLLLMTEPHVYVGEDVNCDMNLQFVTFIKLMFFISTSASVSIKNLRRETSSMRRCEWHTHVCETRGQCVILQEAVIDSPSGSDWGRDPPSGIGPSSAPVQPQLLDGRMAWPPAKRNVYTNTHNCSVRSHGELTAMRRGGSRELLWLQRDRCTSGKRGRWRGEERRGEDRTGPKLPHRIYIWFPCLKWNTQADTSFVIRPWWIHFTAVFSVMVKYEHHTVWHEFFTSNLKAWKMASCKQRSMVMFSWYYLIKTWKSVK